MKANEMQVGGNHYRKVEGEQHWDRLVRLFGLEKARCYFIGNITAYVERYLEKDGVESLRKAAHYIQKLIELEEAELEKKRMNENYAQRAAREALLETNGDQQ
jgi:hypothetical protein